MPFILSAVALGTIGYGIKKSLNDEECRDTIKDKRQDVTFAYGFDKDDNYPSLNAFYSLREDIYKNDFTLYKNTISKINNLNNKDIIINLKNTKTTSDEFKTDIENIVLELSNNLIKLNTKFNENIKDIENIIAVSNDYNAYSQDAKEKINTLVQLANNIADILNLKIINKNNKVTKSAKKYFFNLRDSSFEKMWLTMEKLI